MDEHGLPIVGAGVDYTKVNTFHLTCLILVAGVAYNLDVVYYFRV